MYIHTCHFHIYNVKRMYMYLYIYIYTHYYHHKMCAGYLKPPKAATSERSTQGVDRLTSLNGRAQDALETPRTEKKGRAGISKWVIPPKNWKTEENRGKYHSASWFVVLVVGQSWGLKMHQNQARCRPKKKHMVPHFKNHLNLPENADISVAHVFLRVHFEGRQKRHYW